MWRDESVDGLKTGYTETAGYCLVNSAERSGMRLVSVVIDSRSAEQPAGVIDRRPCRTAQHPDQRAMAHLLPLDRRGCVRRGNCGLSLRGFEVNGKNGMRPVHPGEVLREELDALALSANALSKELGVPVNRVTMILNGQRGVSADTALRLARYFGTTPQFWLNLQKTWELRRAEIETGLEIVERITPRQSAA